MPPTARSAMIAGQRGSVLGTGAIKITAACVAVSRADRAAPFRTGPTARTVLRARIRSARAATSPVRFSFRSLLLEMSARIERRGLGELLVECPLALARRGRHGDLDDREEVSFSRVRLGEAATGEPQLLAGARSGRDLQAHRSGEGGDLHARAEHRFPWRERQVEVEIVAARAKEPMRMQGDAEIQVAVAPAVQAFAPLAGHAQALAVGGALRNARLERAAHAARETLLVVFGHLELEIDLGAAVRILQRNVRGDFVILSGHADLAAARSPAAAAAGKVREQISQIEIVEGERPAAELLLPVRRRAKV